MQRAPVEVLTPTRMSSTQPHSEYVNALCKHHYQITYLLPIPIAPTAVLPQLRKCLQEAEPTSFIGIPLAQAASVALGWGKETLQKRLTVGGQPRGWGGLTLDAVLALGRASLASMTPAAAVAGSQARLVSSASSLLPALSRDDVAAIAFTSGSTGVAKGVMYKHKHFVAQVRGLGCMQGHTHAVLGGWGQAPSV